MTDTSSNHLTGSQKVIGSIPIFSTENQRVTSRIVTLFFWTNNSRYYLLRTRQFRKWSKQSQPPFSVNPYNLHSSELYLRYWSGKLNTGYWNNWGLIWVSLYQLTLNQFSRARKAKVPKLNQHNS